MLKAILLFGVLSLLGSCGGATTTESGSTDSEQDTPDYAPAAASFTYFDGTEGSLADFLGAPLVVNFWASYCTPCITEMPDLEKVYQEFKSHVAFLGLNFYDNLEDALALVELTGVTYPLGRVNDGVILLEFGGISLPTTALVKPDGSVAVRRGTRIQAKELRELISEHFAINS